MVAYTHSRIDCQQTDLKWALLSEQMCTDEQYLNGVSVTIMCK